MSKHIYVACPITVGDQMLNIKRGLDAATRLLESGYVPFVPVLTCFWHLNNPQHYETWMSYDFKWIAKCDGILALAMECESKGRDREIAYAKEIGLPVFYNICDVKLHDWSSNAV